MINNVDIDYEWLIKEIKNKNPRNFIEIFNYTCDILKIDRINGNVINESWCYINKVINIMCNLDKDLLAIHVHGSLC